MTTTGSLRFRRAAARLGSGALALVVACSAATGPVASTQDLGSSPESLATAPSTEGAVEPQADPTIDGGGGAVDSPRPSQTAEDALRDGVFPAIAELPFDLRVNRVEPGTRGATTRMVTDENVWIVSSPNPDDSVEGIVVGDPSGVYGQDFVHLSTYSEILLLDAAESKILKAFPITPYSAPRAIAISPDAVFCHRAGDGGEPASMLCRIDRTELDMIVRIFPSVSGSWFEEPETWIPEGWIINDPIDEPLVGVLEADEELRLISDEGATVFDPETLEVVSEGSK